MDAELYWQYAEAKGDGDTASTVLHGTLVMSSSVARGKARVKAVASDEDRRGPTLPTSLPLKVRVKAGQVAREKTPKVVTGK